MALHRNNWETDEYTADESWDEVKGYKDAVRQKNPSGLFGVGHDMGRLAIFGTPSSFHPETGHPTGYLLSSMGSVPFPGSDSNRRAVPQEAKEGYKRWDVKEVDPRELVATQSSVRSDALSHYMDLSNIKAGHLFDKTRDESNDHPTVVGFQRQKFILSGHHRATAALLRGEPLAARYRHIS
jgi:hypothetical protein